jgi:serine-type D-Ala-D-Ala carboxypeptidase/endopeptidase (penicillin-binding protein 4)
VIVRSGHKVGENAQVFLDPENSYLRSVSEVKTIAGDGINIISDRKEDSVNEGDVFKIRGQIGIKKTEHVIFKNILKPDLWSGANLVAMLAQRGIKLKGKVKTGHTPEGLETLAKIDSKPSQDLVTDMDKFSNNFVAEMLCKHVGLKLKAPGDIANGMKQIRDLAVGWGISESEFKLINPSGLTRENRLSSRALVRLLEVIHERFDFWPELLSSLPIGGVDGTLKKRFTSEKMKRHVRAKTGMLDGVVALAGYVGEQKSQPIQFAFLYNGAGDEARVRAVMDQIVELLLDAEASNEVL